MPRGKTSSQEESAKKEVQFANVASDKEDRNQLFKIARQMVRTNADVVDDKCGTNDDGELACTDSEKLSAWKQHYEKLVNEEFPWEKEHLVHTKNPVKVPIAK